MLVEIDERREMRKVMNYNEFMKAIDDELSIMSEVEKTKWIHNIARTITE